MADCAPLDVFCQARSALGSAVSGVVESAFEAMCRQFAEAGAAVLKAVADAFLTASTIDLAKSGIDRVLLVTTAIGTSVAVLLLLAQVIRTGFTMRGEYLAQGLIGVLKAGLATACVASVAALLLVVADEISVMIMEETFGSTEAFSERFANAVTLTSFSNGGPALPAALLLIFGLIAVIVGAILFGEMLFRHAAIVVIVAVSPIAAAGMVAGSTAAWWRKLVTAGVQLIFLKPLIVLVFAVGFGVAGESDDVLGVLAGLATLLMAAFAWPALARMCTWTSSHIGEAGGLTSFAGGMLGARAAQMPGRVMSVQSRGSAFDSDRATIARNHAGIDARLAAVPRQGGGPSLAPMGAAGAVAAGAAAMGSYAGSRIPRAGGIDTASGPGFGAPPSPTPSANATNPTERYDPGPHPPARSAGPNQPDLGERP
ncbi:hypothetical protein GCM10009547_34860 [Sporichthya brevicatena]|uniref:TrbL/VirB6 plasmid conjugal transfer protein n=1 Tax=Sporichthya brevicatena TaxID=171442 RepID=A0ABN1H3T2_9ACTN